jgi:hypothetical protein
VLLGRIPAGKGAAAARCWVVAGKKIEQCGWRKGEFGRFVAALGLQKRGKGIEEGMTTAAFRMAGSEVAVTVRVLAILDIFC